MFELIKSHQQKIALVFGFVAVATLGFWGGMQMNKPSDKQPVVSASSSGTNYNATNQTVQTSQTDNSSTTTVGDCAGKIKGSASHIYHVPGDAFYTRTTNPIACFDTEAQAIAAGFRKSK